jgi:hypothetical protein
MSFGLKNAGATYQRAIQACFKRQLNKNVEAYVDDMVIKTRNSDTLIADLEETFASLREYRWKLNPNKCVFCVPSGKLLGFIIIHRGIEANPEKISTITKMKAPTCIKDTQKHTGCMAALNRFISKLGEQGLPFFKLLRHQEKFVWTPEADQALAQLKDFLSKPPVLTAPRKKGAATALPRRDYSRGQYCHRRRAAGRRPRLPSPATSLLRQRGPVGIQGTIPTSTKATICSAHHLAEAATLLPGVLDHRRHRLPARRHLTKPGCYRRLSKWAVELGALTIDFKPRTTIKSQALFDFMAEWRENQLPTPTERPEHWVMYFDGSLKLEGASAGVLLISPKGEQLKYVLQIF